MGTINTIINENSPQDSFESATSSLSRSYLHGANQYGREVIAASMKHGVSISTIYKETLRSIRNIFSNFFYIDGNKKLTRVECILGNPERTVAKLFQENNLKLPIISVVQINSEDADDRRRYIPQLVVETVWNDEIRRAQRVLSVVPRPVNINYEIVIWSKYNEDLDHIVTQVRSSFTPRLDVITPESDLSKDFIVSEDFTSIGVIFCSTGLGINSFAIIALDMFYHLLYRLIALQL